MRRTSTFLLLISLLYVPLLHTQADSNATQLFDRGMNALKGSGPSHNNQTALDLLRRSAELRYVPAQTVVGCFYETGFLVPAEPGQAAEWYRKAAVQDDRLGEWLLGRLYYTGAGVPRDWSLAERWLLKAADQGDPFSQYLLGTIKREQGENAKAANWFRKAAEQGLPQAQQQLAQLLKQGLGVTADKFEGYVWLLVSADNGYPAAIQDLASLEADLGSTQVEQAKSRARELEKTMSRSVTAHGCTGWPGEFAAVPAPPPPDLQRFCR